MKKLLILITVFFIFLSLTACKKEDTELYINSEFDEVTMKNIYGISRNVAKAIEENCFAAEEEIGVSFILPEKWSEYNTDIQVQTIEGGIGVYAFAKGYDLTSFDYVPYYADLFAVIYVTKGESESLITKYKDYFKKSKYLGYMDDKVCYLLYNEKIDRERSTEFTDDEYKYWKEFLKITSQIDDYIMLNAEE